MSEAERERCLDELKHHEAEISTLSLALVDLDSRLAGAGRAREARRGLECHATYITAQVMRHRISMALLQSRLGMLTLQPE